MSHPTPNNSYYILSSGGVLTLDLANGTRCIGWSPHFNEIARNRVWTLHDMGLGAWKIVNVQDGVALTLQGGSARNETAVVGEPEGQTGTGTVRDEQLWYFEEVVGRSEYQAVSFGLRNKASGTLMDLAGGGSSDGTRIIGYGAHGGWNQRWILIPANILGKENARQA